MIFIRIVERDFNLMLAQNPDAPDQLNDRPAVKLFHSGELTKLIDPAAAFAAVLKYSGDFFLPACDGRLQRVIFIRILPLQSQVFLFGQAAVDQAFIQPGFI